MDNSSRRGFFGQLFAGLTGCIFFPFFKSKYKIPPLAYPGEFVISKRFLKEFGDPVALKIVVMDGIV